MRNEIDLDRIDTTLDPPAYEPMRQYYYMAKCREMIRKKEREAGRPMTVCVNTFGCQMNGKIEKMQK